MLNCTGQEQYRLTAVVSPVSPVSPVVNVCVLHPVPKDQWGHVEEIDLVNDGSGLGFGIVGGKTSGVVVRTLVPNSVADKVRESADQCYIMV